VTETAIWRLHQEVFILLLVLYLSLIEPLVLFGIELLKVSIGLLAGTTIHVDIATPLDGPESLSGGRLDSSELGNSFNEYRDNRIGIKSDLRFPEFLLRLLLLLDDRLIRLSDRLLLNDELRAVLVEADQCVPSECLIQFMNDFFM
jgi:hypothetical protein